MKTQTIRLLDVFAIGPLMVWAGWKLMGEHPLPGQLLAVSGVATVLYNGRNYLRVERGGFLPGGYADGMDARGVDPEQLRLGVRTEMEHTNDPEIAREIALDHLIGEDPLYYTKLKRAGL